MSGIFGIIGPSHASPSPCLVEAMAAPCTADPAHVVQSIPVRGGMMGASLLHENGLVLHEDHYAAAIIGRPYRSGVSQPHGDAQVFYLTVIEALLEGKFRMLSELSGGFALAVLDYRKDRLVLAVDKIGMYTLTYHESSDAFFFSTSADSIAGATAGAGNLNIRPQSVYDYIYFHTVPGPETIYREVRKMPHGTCLTVDHGPPSLTHYWRAEYPEDRTAGFDALKNEFLERLRSSVAHSAAGADCGAYLSGGTDSSTVVGMLRDVLGRPPETYSIGFDVPGYDEMDYARIAARHFGTNQHEYYLSPQDVVDAIPLIAKTYDAPFGNSSAVASYCCARIAHDNGTRRLLAGDGGDELFGGNYRYAKQYLYSLYDRAPSMLRRYVVEPFLLHGPGIAHIPLLRKAQSYVRQARVPMPDRMETYNLIERIGPDEIFTQEFLSAIDMQAPLALLSETYHDARAGTMLNKMLALDMKITLADNDLPKVVKTCELAGVEPAFPLLSGEVMDFASRLPSSMKLRGTRLRYFFKKALQGYLPDEIIKKPKHGFGLPFGPWLQTYGPLKELTLDSLSDLKARGYINPSFIDNLIEERLGAHAGYYGTMVWVLVMLEQWFQQRRM